MHMLHTVGLKEPGHMCTFHVHVRPKYMRTCRSYMHMHTYACIHMHAWHGTVGPEEPDDEKTGEHDEQDERAKEHLDDEPEQVHPRLKPRLPSLPLLDLALLIE